MDEQPLYREQQHLYVLVHENDDDDEEEEKVANEKKESPENYFECRENNSNDLELRILRLNSKTGDKFRDRQLSILAVLLFLVF